MSDETRNYYEGLFLFPQAMAGRMSEMITHVDEVLERAGARLIAMSKWHEGNLAYTIKKSRRGIYILAYFEANPERIVGLERDSNLSELIIRFMITRADHLTEEEMAATDGRQALEQEARLKRDGTVPTAGASANNDDRDEPESVSVAAGADEDAENDNEDENA